MSQGSLARDLSQLERFEEPKLELEQYATPGELAAELLWNAHMHGDIEGKRIVDLGAGTGVLGIGCLLLGAAHVTFVELDPDAIRILERNLTDFDASRYEIMKADVASTTGRFDTAVMNPPFGAQQRHADRMFLERAFAVAHAIYSIHNANAQRFLEAFSRDEHRELRILSERVLPIRASFAHHRKPRVDQEVIVCTFT